MIKKISFQGELGAYSHLACQKAMPDHEPEPHRTFEAALDAVRTVSYTHLTLPTKRIV